MFDNELVTTPESTRAKPGRKRRAITSAAVVGAFAVGAVSTANAHHTVTLDVHGDVQQIGTFRRTVGALLEREGIELGEHDTLSPAAEAQLADGVEIVVRYASEIDAEVDGEPTKEWVAALDASDALDVLRERGRDVRLVASRSAGRTELPLRMTTPGALIAVVADGRTVTVRYEAAPLEATLRAAGVTVSDEDGVTLLSPEDAGVDPAIDAALAIVVQRIRTEEVREYFPIPHESVETIDAQRFDDLPPLVVQAGADGERVRGYLVTTVDGIEVEREFVGESVTVEPVDHILAVGTRLRPPPPLPTGPVSEEVWQALAQCESSGNPRAVSASGRFHGLYQFSIPTWQAMGGTGLPSEASPREQRERAVALQARWGWGQWPACSARLGLR